MSFNSKMSFRELFSNATWIVFLDLSGSTQDGYIAQAIYADYLLISEMILNDFGCNNIKVIPFSSTYISLQYDNFGDILADDIMHRVPHKCTQMYNTIHKIIIDIPTNMPLFSIVLTDGYDDNYRSSHTILNKIALQLAQFPFCSMTLLFYMPHGKSQRPLFDSEFKNYVDQQILSFSHKHIGCVDPANPAWEPATCVNRNDEGKHLCMGCSKKLSTISPEYYYNQTIKGNFSAMLKILKVASASLFTVSVHDKPNERNACYCIISSILTAIVAHYNPKYCMLMKCYKINENGTGCVKKAPDCQINNHINFPPKTKHEVIVHACLMEQRDKRRQMANICLCSPAGPCKKSGLLVHICDVFELCPFGSSCRFRTMARGCRNGKNHNTNQVLHWLQLLNNAYITNTKHCINIPNFGNFPTLKKPNFVISYRAWQADILLSVHDKSTLQDISYDVMQLILAFVGGDNYAYDDLCAQYRIDEKGNLSGSQ